MQTGATALLGAAAVAALCGVVHLFDLRSPRPVSIVEPAAEPVWPAAPERARTPVAVAVEPEPAPAGVAEAEPTAVAASDPSVKPARKPAAKVGKGRAVKAAKAPAPKVEIFEAPQAPLSPLFEPEPFMRQQQRSMFGRKAG
jgi:hypothetical protein